MDEMGWAQIPHMQCIESPADPLPIRFGEFLMHLHIVIEENG